LLFGRCTNLVLSAYVVARYLLRLPAYAREATQDGVTMNDDQIQRFLERLGHAMSVGDLAEVAQCWDVPALVLTDDSAIAISDSAELKPFFARAAEGYRSQGLVATRPELERVEPLTARLTAVDVRWPTFNAAGAEQSSERSHYIVWHGDDGQPRIRVALTRTR
jgi:hypothetical protein